MSNAKYWTSRGAAERRQARDVALDRGFNGLARSPIDTDPDPDPDDESLADRCRVASPCTGESGTGRWKDEEETVETELTPEDFATPARVQWLVDVMPLDQLRTWRGGYACEGSATVVLVTALDTLTFLGATRCGNRDLGEIGELLDKLCEQFGPPASLSMDGATLDLAVGLLSWAVKHDAVIKPILFEVPPASTEIH